MCPSVAAFLRERERGIARGRRALPYPSCVYLLPALYAVGKSNAHALANRVITPSSARTSARKDSDALVHRGFAALLLANDNSKFRHAVVAWPRRVNSRRTSYRSSAKSRVPDTKAATRLPASSPPAKCRQPGAAGGPMCRSVGYWIALGAASPRRFGRRRVPPDASIPRTMRPNTKGGRSRPAASIRRSTSAVTAWGSRLGSLSANFGRPACV